MRVGLLLFLLGLFLFAYGLQRYGRVQAQLEEMRAKVVLIPQMEAEVVALERELAEVRRMEAELRGAALRGPNPDLVLDTALRVAAKAGVTLLSLGQTRFEALGETLFLSGYAIEVEGRYPSVQAFWELLQGEAPFRPFLEGVSLSVKGPLLVSRGGMGVLVYEER